MTVPEERRVVCIAFAQAVGLADLPEAERVAAADALFARLRAAVERHGGAVDKFIGDTVMALWGAPVAHEDDPGRAVRCALEMVAEARAAGFELRVGVNRGEVLYGRVGGDRATVMGDPVNVAQRLEAAASPGQVLVARALERLAPAEALYAALPPLQVKGRQAAVEASRAVAAAPGRTEARIAPDLAFPLVGRDAELDRLLALVDRLPSFAVLEGGAGVGKSRLLAEFRRRLRGSRAGCRVLVGRALESVRLPMFAMGEILRNEAGVAGFERGDADALVRRVMSDLDPDGGRPVEAENQAHLIVTGLGYAVPAARIRDLEPARRRSETWHAWALWLGALAARSPVLLCIEDLHWADEATLGFLSRLPGTMAGARLGVVASSRPGVAPPPGFTTLAVGELPAPAALALARSRLGAPLSPGLQQAFLEKTGGNPYFVEELARFLKSEGLVSGEPLRLTAGAARIPDGLHGLLVSRLDALDPADKEALKGASVVGRVFWEGFLSALLGRDAGPALADSRRRELTFEQDGSLLAGDRQHAFRHALLRDAAYSLVTKKERSRLHGAAAELLEARTAAGGRRIKVLAAVHREGAGAPGEAARLLCEAAEEAMEENAADEALSHAREAARLGAASRAAVVSADALFALARFGEALAEADSALADPAAAPGLAAEARFHRARALFGRGEFREAEAEAVAAAQAAADARVRARAWTSAASARRRLGERGAAEEALALAEAACGDGPESLAARAQLLRERAQLAESTGDYAAAAALGREAIAASRRLGNRAGVAAGEGLLGNLAWRQGRFDEALAAYEQSLAARRECGDRAGVGASLGNIGLVRARQGRFDEALRAYEASLAIAVETGDRAGIAAGHGDIGALLYRQSRCEEARARFEQSLALRREIGEAEGIANCLTNLGAVLDRLGRPEDGLRAHEEALDIQGRIGNRSGVAAALACVGLTLAGLGRKEEALRSQEEALGKFRELGDRHGIAAMLCNVAMLCIGRGEHGRAEAWVREALALYEASGDRAGTGWCRERLGYLAICRGQDAEARELLEAAVRGLRGVGDPAMLSFALAQLARAKPRGGGAEAAGLLAEAHSLARSAANPLSQANAAFWLARLSPPSAARPLLEEALLSAKAARDRVWEACISAEIAALDAASAPEKALAALEAVLAGPAPEDLLARALLAESEARVRRAAGQRTRAREAVVRTLESLLAVGAPGLAAPLESLRQSLDAADPA